MSKSFIFSFVFLALVGCTSQSIPKKPPLVAQSQKWAVINADDFVPPKAKTYIRLEAVDLEKPNTNAEQEEE